MTNRLAQSNSPYLLQHQNNPVDWYPWGEEALGRATAENRPIFLSIGYSACHWCHVMEHESFENPAIAELLNSNFVCIKVDREERPDLDQIYMHAVQAMTGQGGWPMSMFLTPDRKPFYGGTYFPPTARMGMPGFDQIIEAVRDAWESKSADVVEQADRMTQHLQTALARQTPSGESLRRQWIDMACEQKAKSFDRANGGFGSRPKFPHPSDLELLLRQWKATGQSRWLEIVEVTLTKMANGGIYDHLGGGFARYAVDERWLVPHFEKMLYDNAQLAKLYGMAYQATGREFYLEVAKEILVYLSRDMLDPCGGFHSAEDADSEGEEGRYYVWTLEELREILGEKRAPRFAEIYDVTERGNFEGKNILHLDESLEQVATNRAMPLKELAGELREDRQKLLNARQRRVRPGRDDKILVSWNAMAIDAFAFCSRILGDEEFLEIARATGEFIWSSMRNEDGRLLHAFRSGEAYLNAYLDDYASVITAMVSLYEATGDNVWIERAIVLSDGMRELFEDPVDGGFYYTGTDHESLIVRTKDFHDSSVPSGNGEAAYALLRLGRILDSEAMQSASRKTLQAAGDVMAHQSMAAGRLLIALDDETAAAEHYVMATDEEQCEAVRRMYFQRYHPHGLFVFSGSEADSVQIPITRDKPQIESNPTLYLCRDHTCEAPVVSLEQIKTRLLQ